MTTIRARLPWLCALVALIALAAGSAFAAGEIPKGPSELLFIAQIVLLLLTGRLLGEVVASGKRLEFGVARSPVT
jgi:hypothetical protein